MRSAAAIQNAILICLFVTATVMFLQCAAQNETLGRQRFKRWIDVEKDIFDNWMYLAASNSAHAGVYGDYSEHISLAMPRKTEQFLVGNDTPLWIAYDNDGAGPKYKRYNLPSVVGRAMQFLMSSKKNIDYDDTYLWPVDHYINEASKIDRSRSNIDQGCSDDNECTSELYPPINGVRIVYINPLVVLDMQGINNMDPARPLKGLSKRLAYIAAFWNMVNIKLNKLITTTKVVIRIAGIILAEDEGAFRAWTGGTRNTLREVFDGMKDSFEKTQAWTSTFPPASYDFVAFMTSANLYEGPYLPQGVSSWRPLCVDDNHPIGNIMIWDNFSFVGVELAVQELINVLGPKEVEVRTRYYPRTAWSASTDLRPNKCDTRRTAAFLPYAWCLSKPKEYFPPGNPLRPILPGAMMGLPGYCASLGFSPFDNHQRLNPGCSQLQCSGPLRTDAWYNMGRAVDGIPCSPDYDSMVCMDGQCVKNQWKTRIK